MSRHQGQLFEVILWPALIGVLAGNTIQAAADLGGMAAAIYIFVPVPIPLLVVAVAGIILALQIFGSYQLIRTCSAGLR